MRTPPGRVFLFAKPLLRRLVRYWRAGVGVVVFLILLVIGPFAQAQTGPSTLPAFSGGAQNPNAQMLLQADELLYDNDAKTVTATGNVQIFHDGYNVIAERVVYYKTTRRVIAKGDVRITDPVGNVYYSDQADISQNFSEGFIRSLRLEHIDRTHLAADSAERRDGNLTIFNRGVYTACEPCKENPQKPPLWQVKATRIISDQKEQTVYFENARIEFFGLPIAYIPYFWAPDSTVKRKSGILTPSFYYNRRIGNGINIPYYFALSPFYDLTFTTNLTTPQGPHFDLLWRHALPSGFYSVRGTGIYQLDPDNVGIGAGDSGNRLWRGSLQTTGEFFVADKWTLGWDATFDSDPRYLKDYGYVSLARTERASTLYLQGKGERSFFDARAYYFRDLLDVNTDPRERQAIQPIVAPVIDYNTAMADPYFGGEFKLDANLTHLTREEQQSYAVNDPDGLGPVPPGPLPAGKYLTPGFAGDYTRLSLNAQWRKTFTDAIGQRITPFAHLRGDIYRYGVRNVNPFVDDLGTTGAEAVQNAVTMPLSATIPGLIANQNDLGFRGMPTIGVDYRYPFVATTGSITHQFEPIVQLIVRPNETHIGEVPNEDAHSLVYDDANLFEIDKFSGYDRIEGGTRANAGVQYSLQTAEGLRASALFGQSYHLSGLNSFAQGATDINGTGLDSGIETGTADYVARLYVQPWKYGDLSARFRFDEDDWSMQRFEFDARFYYGPLFLSTAYIQREALPNLGIATDLEEVSLYGSYNITDEWSVYAGGRYSIQNTVDNDGFVSNQFGVKYSDECFTISVDYTQIYRNYGDLEPQGQLMFRFNLRTLGDGNLTTRIGPST